MLVQPSRLRPSNRIPTHSDKQPYAQSVSYAAPVGGWMSNVNLALQGQQSAVVLENFWPTATGIEPRGGTRLRTAISGEPVTLFEYKAGPFGEFFVADETRIFKFTDLTGANVTEVISGQSSGAYSVNEIRNAGGSFLTLLNGKDDMLLYDGSTWHAVTSSTSPYAISDIETHKLSHVWSYNNRQFFIEKNSMNAWYLGINSIAGDATKLPLSGLFRKGGSLYFGANWSSDSGEDLNDRCLFVTDQGEVAVFHGDPASIQSWGLDGVFDIGKPLGPRSIMSIGGDLLIATEAGLIPMSAVMQKDASQLKLSSLSAAIEQDWTQQVLLSGSENWRVEKWTSRNMGLVVPPQAFSDESYLFAVNLETGAWTKFTGWRVNDLAVLGDDLHYCDPAGEILQCDVGGTDNGDLIHCRMCMAFDTMGMPDRIKQSHLVRPQFRYASPFLPQISIAGDYRPQFPNAPNVPSEQDREAALWDEVDWDAAKWATGLTDWKIKQGWESVSGMGRSLALQLQMTLGSTWKPSCELIAIDLQYSIGGSVG